MSNDIANVYFGNIKNKTNVYSHDSAFIVDDSQIKIKSKIQQLKIYKYNINKNIIHKNITQLMISEEDINFDKKIYENIFIKEEYTNDYNKSSNEVKLKLNIIDYHYFNTNTNSDIKTHNSVLKIIEPKELNTSKSYFKLNVIYEGPAEPNREGGDIRNLIYTCNINTFLSINFDFMNGKISNIKGIPAGLELFPEDNCLKGIPITHGTYNCIIILSTGNEIRLTINILPVIRKF